MTEGWEYNENLTVLHFMTNENSVCPNNIRLIFVTTFLASALLGINWSYNIINNFESQFPAAYKSVLDKRAARNSQRKMSLVRPRHNGGGGWRGPQQMARRYEPQCHDNGRTKF